MLRSVNRCVGPSESSPDCSDSCDLLDDGSPGNLVPLPSPWRHAWVLLPRPRAPRVSIVSGAVALVPLTLRPCCHGDAPAAGGAVLRPADLLGDQQVKCCKRADEGEEDEDEGWGTWSGPAGHRRVLAPHLPRASPEHHLLVQQVALWGGSPRAPAETRSSSVKN